MFDNKSPEDWTGALKNWRFPFFPLYWFIVVASKYFYNNEIYTSAAEMFKCFDENWAVCFKTRTLLHVYSQDLEIKKWIT